MNSCDTAAKQAAGKRRRRVPGKNNHKLYERIDAAGKTVYEIAVRNAKGNQTFVTAANKHKISAARSERDRLHGEVSTGKVVIDNARLTYGQACDGYVKNQVADLAPRTREGYEGAIRNHLRRRWGSRRIDKISVDDAAQMVRDWRAEEASEATIAGRLVVAGRVFRFAKRRMNSHAENVIALLDAGERAKLSEVPAKRYFTPSELDQTLASAREPWNLPFTVAAVTGARQSEVAGLQWDDWDLEDVDAASVGFEWQIDRHGKRVKLKTEESRRVVDVPRFLAVRMLELKARSQFSKGGHFCFCTRTGRPYSQRNLARELRKAQTRAVTPEGKPTFPLLHVKDEDGKPVKPPKNTIPSFHGFRHSAASEAIADGEPIEDVADRLGHKSTIVTETIYRHQIKTAERSAANRAKLETRYGSRMAAAERSEAQETATEGQGEVVNLATVRSSRQ
jgi:integrase